MDVTLAPGPVVSGAKYRRTRFAALYLAASVTEELTLYQMLLGTWSDSRVSRCSGEHCLSREHRITTFLTVLAGTSVTKSTCHRVLRTTDIEVKALHGIDYSARVTTLRLCRVSRGRQISYLDQPWNNDVASLLFFLVTLCLHALLLRQ